MKKRQQKIREVLCAKAKEYATNDNRFHNFDEAARLLNCTPEEALNGMLVKHWVSIMDLIDTSPPVAEELISEKIGDAINYVILREGLRLRYVDTFEDVVEDYIVFVQPYIGGSGFTKNDMEQLWYAGLSSRTVISYLATLEHFLYQRNENQPKYRPYTTQELFDLYASQEPVCAKDRKAHYYIQDFHASGTYGAPTACSVHVAGRDWTPDALLKHFVLSDGSPCGIKEVNHGY